MTDEEVLLKRNEGPVCWLTLNRPERLNAFNQPLRLALKEALEKARGDASTRVVVVTGAGRAFCAGGDLKIMAELKQRNAPFEDFLPFLTLGEDIVRMLIDYPIPTIALVNGPAAGAGLSLALACDLRYASRIATFAMSFVRIGLHPDWGSTYTLPRAIGYTWALEMAWLGEPITADRALQIGLIHRVLPEGELHDEVSRIANKLAGYSRDLLRTIKESLRTGEGADLDTCVRRERTLQKERWESPESTEGILRFFRR
ncbi:MAG: enoyl-CoA hydratase/isomerase family protein [bacterium JZ-2024 1]